MVPKLLTATDHYSNIKPFGISISTLIADSMARINMSPDLNIGIDANAVLSVGPIDLDTPHAYFNTYPPKITTALAMTTLQYGYSYSMRGITRRLAGAILLLHTFLAIIHTVIVVSYGWKSRTLGSLSEIF
jgi:hypothetical protein